MTERSKTVEKVLEICEKLIDQMTDEQLDNWLRTCEGAVIMQRVLADKVA